MLLEPKSIAFIVQKDSFWKPKAILLDFRSFAAFDNTYIGQ